MDRGYCTSGINRNVAAGNVHKELINFGRDVFGNAAYGTLPSGIGYCVAEEPEVRLDVDSELMNARVVVTGHVPEIGPVGEDLFDTPGSDPSVLSVAIVGLASAPLPAALGLSGGDIATVSPAFGQETCDVVSVLRVDVAGTMTMPGAHSTDTVQETLQGALDGYFGDIAGTASVALTKAVITLSSDFTLPVNSDKQVLPSL